MSDKPLVSIAIPSYKPRYFEAALLSALNQSYDCVEILVSDDCPNEDIQQIVERHLQHSRHPIRVIRNQPGLGGLLNYTQCVVEARGEFIKFLNDDDILLGDCVERMVRVFTDNSDVSLVTSRRLLIDDVGLLKPDIIETCKPFEVDMLVNGVDLTSFLADAPQNFIGEPSTVMFRREHLVNVLPNVCSLNGQTVRAINDLAMYVNLLRHGNMAYLCDPLSCFRIHPEQRQAQADMFPLWQQGVKVFGAQIRAMGIYNPLQGGVVRCKPLSDKFIGWHDYALRRKFLELAQQIDRQRAKLNCENSNDKGTGTHLNPAESSKGMVSNSADNSKGKHDIAVVVHAYYFEVLQEIVDYLKPLYGAAKFYFTTTPDKAGEVGRILDGSIPGYSLYVFENRGRDIGPLFELMQSIALEDYTYVLKLHTKRSPHLKSGEGDKWRSSSLQQLLPEGSVQKVIDFFESHSEVGLAGSSASLFRAADLLGAHYENHSGLKHWADVLGFDFDQIDYNFIGGTMFWARGALFRELRALDLRQADFDDESGQLDGTLAHVLERIIPLVAVKIGLQTVGLPAFKDAPLPLQLIRPEQTLRVWNDARKYSALELAKINSNLHSKGGGPKICVVVFDDDTDKFALTATLNSVNKSIAIYKNLNAIIVSESECSRDFKKLNIEYIRCESINYINCANEFLQNSEFDWVLSVRSGEQLLPEGILSTAVNLLSAGECRAVYADEFIEMNDGALSGVLRPAFNLDMLISFPLMMVKHWFVQRKTFNDLGGYSSEVLDVFEFDFILRLIDDGGISRIGHISDPIIVGKPPKLRDDEQERALILKHIQRRGYSQAKLVPHMPGRYRIDYGHEQQPLVSIIVPTKDQLPILQRCVESLLEKTRYANYELLIVDNNSETPEACDWLDAVAQMGEEKVRVLRYPHPFNYSAINNMAAREARGEYLVLLNNDTAIISETWLDDLLNHAQRPEVGIVGAKLLYPDGRIQHAGVILGLRGPAEHPFIGEPMDAPGYMQRLQVDQNYSAVTAACLMIRKSIYDEVGGLDEEFFKVSYNDIDLCLKVGQQGYLIVWTPHAVVMHEGSVSQKQVDPATQEAKRKRFLTEQDAMYEKWLPQLANDPAYNGNLALTGSGFALETNVDMTWRPLSWRPLPVVLAHNADPWGCGNYRVIKPHKAMKTAGLIDGAVSTRLLEPAELARLSPDVVVYQRQTKPESIENMARSKRFSSAFKVYELDDYLPNTPMKNAHRTSLSKGLVKLLRKGLGHVDRFVVSTPALANALTDYHPDIRVIENRLPLDWWGQLDIVKNQSAKPRVGWAGGIGHQGDLELIADVVRELAKEVDWVFFGMCPEDLKPYMTEFYPGVDIELYPQKLASLNLDLALAPLEDNLFNACKSNLRLLEYGVCGFPVIASDIECYRGSLPVTLVKNRYRDWVDSIRGQLAEREALSASADALQNAVRKDWMLDGVNLEQWRSAWLPD